MCSPTGEKMFTANIVKDLKLSNKCIPYEADNINAYGFIQNDVKYYFTLDKTIFEYNEQLEAFN